MIAVDTNLLVYAHRPEMGVHDRAQQSLRTLVDAAAAWAIPWPCVHEFLRVVTDGRLYAVPTPSAVAVRTIAVYLALPHCRVLGEGRDHLDDLADVLAQSGVTGPKVHDARIAAICRSHGVSELWTADRDFGRFPWLRIHNPLVAGSLED